MTNLGDIGLLLDELTIQGYARLRLGKPFAARLERVVGKFYDLGTPKRLELCASQRLGFLGYIPSEAEARLAVERGIGEFPVFSDARRRGYSSYDFVVNSKVFSPLGIGITNIWPTDRRLRREICNLYRETQDFMLDISKRMVCELKDRGFQCFLDSHDFGSICCSIMRLLEYPPLVEPSKSKEHTDYEFLSFVYAGTEGLEVRDQHGVWQAVGDTADTAIILPGDMFQLATNGSIRSTTHRAQYGEVIRRVVVYFQGLRYDELLPKDHCYVADCFGHHLCGMCIRGTPHLAEKLVDGSLNVGFDIPLKNPIGSID